MSLAQRLDASDGVVDGRYYGRPIVEVGSPTHLARYRSSARTSAALDPSYRRIDCKTGGCRSFASSAAYAVDAADGVIDGRYYGRPIIETSGRSYVNRSSGYPIRHHGGYSSSAAYSVAADGYRSSAAYAVDAADGVLDGRYFGRPIIETTGSTLSGRVLTGTVVEGGALSSSVVRSSGYPVASRTGYRSSAAYAVDAADGVLDGRYFGRPIVETTGSTLSGNVYSSNVVRSSGYPVASRTGYQSSAAYAVDAADGVIDGRYFGRPIVQTSNGYPVQRYLGESQYFNSGAPTSYRSSAAVALDAADGRLDGRYFGRPIVETSCNSCNDIAPTRKVVRADGRVEPY